MKIWKTEKFQRKNWFRYISVVKNPNPNKQTKKLKDLKKFYQLFATVLRWSLENLKKKLPNLSFVWRESESSEERLKKAEFCKKEACGQPNKQTNLKTEKTTPQLKITLKKKLKSWVSLKTDQNWVPNSKKVPKSAKKLILIMFWGRAMHTEL